MSFTLPMRIPARVGQLLGAVSHNTSESHFVEPRDTRCLTIGFDIDHDRFLQLT